MTIKIFRIIEATEEGDNLMGYGFADEEQCVAKVGSKILTYILNEYSTAFDKMVQEQTDDIRGIRVEYQEYDLGETKFIFGK